ncbi:MAG TPA: ATP-binding protein [Bacteroidales bacterium]|nr:ATP-binding protein [Bacteroidales bacterium]
MDIRRLIEQGEGQQLDFKYCVNDAHKIARTLTAFANTNGGTLLLGVKDNGKISGVASDEEYYMIEKAAQTFCKPEVPFRCKTHRCNGKNVFEVIIPSTGFVPHYAPDENNKWLVYIRRNDQNLPANRILLEYKKRLNSGNITAIALDRNVEMLLNYLNRNGAITFDVCRQLTNMNKFSTENFLVNLLLMNLIEMDINEKETVFCLKNIPDNR